MLDTKKIKKDFPIFKNIPNLVYLDSTATSLKPKIVIDKIVEYYEKYSGNVARGLYEISEKATEEYEATRRIVAHFINAPSAEEIIFTRGTTESVNLVCYSLGREILGPGDEIVTTVMEHHSNFVPWQQLAFEIGADFKVADVTDDGKLVDLSGVITKKTKILTLTYVSNVLGTINPIKEISAAAKKINPNIIIFVDAAQAVPHMKIDVADLGCDFLAFSSHKMLGPTGVGVLWGRREILEKMFPFNYGGEMIREVYIDKTIFKEIPHKFEAGTPHIDGVVAFKAAIKYLLDIGFERIRHHEVALTKYCLKRLQEELGGDVKILGPMDEHIKGGVVAFGFGNFHPHDIAQILSDNGVAVRAGNHCAMPLHTRYGLTASVRASFYIYNCREDIDKLIEGLKKVKKILS